VIIPSLDGDRSGNVALLLQDLEGQTEQDFEVILPIHFKPNGHARNQGVRAARGEYLVCIDDDVRLGHDRVLDQLLEPFQRLPKIGMTGPAQLIPKDSTPFQRRAAKEISRSTCPIVTELTDSDFVTHMCLCIPALLYKEVGWESDTLPRGTDPDLRRRLRAAGYRIVIVPNCWAYHPMTASLVKLVKMAWRNGAGSAWVFKYAPEMCLDTPDGHVSEIAPQRPAAYRALRFASRFLQRIGGFEYIGVCSDVAYLCGYTYAMISGRDGLR
jgi:glycosyltransferase involved in cell wall biosynthesis